MLKDVCRINVSVARNNLDVLQRRETTVMDTQHGCRPPCCLVFAEALNCERINRKALGLIQPPPQIIEVLINCEWVATLISVGLKVSYPMVGMVVRGRIDPHRPAALHLIGLVSFLSLAFLFSLFCLPSSTLTSPHLSSPLFLLSRPARAPHINRLWLIRCNCEMHKKNQRWPKLEALCANSWAQPCRDEQAEQAEADDATWGYISHPVILVKYKETSTNPGRRYTQ